MPGAENTSTKKSNCDKKGNAGNSWLRDTPNPRCQENKGSRHSFGLTHHVVEQLNGTIRAAGLAGATEGVKKKEPNRAFPLGRKIQEKGTTYVRKRRPDTEKSSRGVSVTRAQRTRETFPDTKIPV